MVSMSTVGQLDCALPPKMAAALRDSAKQLQMIPEAATKALNMIKEPDCKISHFAAIVEQDVKLASDILRMANSPFYSTGRAVGNVREAVVQVGFRQCQNLIHASCASSLLQRLEGPAEDCRNALWHHSLQTGQLASQLAGKLNLGFSGEEFTAGLMHDIGRLLLAVLAPDDFNAFDHVDFREFDSPIEVEREAIATDHCVVGCFFSVNNGLPDEISEAIRFHHEPERAELCPRLTGLVGAADDLANFIARQDPTEVYDATSNSSLLLLLQQSGVDENPDAIASEVLESVRVEQA